MQMMMEIESSLLGAELLRSPCIFIRPEVDKTTANKVKDIIVNHQGEICGKSFIILSPKSFQLIILFHYLVLRQIGS